VLALSGYDADSHRCGDVMSGHHQSGKATRKVVFEFHALSAALHYGCVHFNGIAIALASKVRVIRIIPKATSSIK
jgi:hypothetical protein